MYKKTVRAFSFGILFSVSILGVGYYSLEDENKDTSLSEAKKIVEEEGLVVLTDADYEKIKNNNNAESDKAVDESNEADVDTKEDRNTESEQKDIITVQFTIKSGMNSGEISLLLMEEKIIEDINDFEQFLKKRGYNTRLQVGTFELNNKMSYEEIGRIITKS